MLHLPLRHCVLLVLAVSLSRCSCGDANIPLDNDGAARVDGALSGDAMSSSDGALVSDSEPTDVALADDAGGDNDAGGDTDASAGDGPLNPDGSLDPDGGLSFVDGGVIEVDGGLVFIDGGFDDSGAAIDGGVVFVDGGLVFVDGGVIDPSDGATGVPDGTLFVDGGFDDLGNPIDGGVITGGDAGATDGSPLTDPLPAFCRGAGTVVSVGESDQCAGNIAQQTFRYALCACQSIGANSNLAVDAFDSTLGTYGGANIRDDGHVGVNQTGLVIGGRLLDRGSVFSGGGSYSVGAQSNVTGLVYSSSAAIQPNGSSSIGRNAYITRDVIGRFNIGGDLHISAGRSVDPRTMVGGMTLREPIPHATPCACDQNQILNIQGLTRFGATHNDNATLMGFSATAWANGGGPSPMTLPCGRYYVTGIRATNSFTIQATGRVVLFVDGDLTATSGLNINLGPGAELDLFVAGSLSTQGAASFGSEAAPSKVRTYVGGTGTIDLGSATTFGGNLYAPNAHIEFGASANLYGAVFAYSVYFPAATEIHFDSAIRGAGSTCSTDGGNGDGGALDGGGGADGGGGVADGSTALDGGTAPADGGIAGNDGSTTGLDGGGVVDAGASDGGGGGSDGGTTSGDGGLCSACTTMCSLSNQACVNGACGPCTVDSECCVPGSICLAGLCVAF